MSLKLQVCFGALLLMVIFAGPSAGQAIIADHTVCAHWVDVPESVIASVISDFHIYYRHTSHGLQLIEGLEIIEAEDSTYDLPYFSEVWDTLGNFGDTTWVPDTRAYLNVHPECNVAMFAWCSELTTNTEEGVNIYLNKLDELSTDYPSVEFIYMTGHMDYWGPDGNRAARNNQIRAYCLANDKVLFDFADIESYDPDGNYYPMTGDRCDWCTDWCQTHDCPDCPLCAHSHCFNCYQKGKATWWMLARLAGWIPGVGIEENGLPPSGFLLEQNKPNPFNGTTIIKYRLPYEENVTINIYDIMGRKVETLLHERQSAGYHDISWEAEGVASGAYLYEVTAGDFIEKRMMLILK